MNKKQYTVIMPQFPEFSLNVLGENIFVIRHKGNSNVFLHRIPHLCTDGQFAWQLKYGEHGCELFTKKNVDEFFKVYEGKDLEPVKLIEVVKFDCSLN